MFSTLWQQLEQLLCQYQPYWRFLPFHQNDAPWQQPELDAWLARLSDADLSQLEQDEPLRRQRLAGFFPDLAAISDWIAAQQHPAVVQSEMPFWLARDIKGRKQQQIEFWVDQLPDLPLPLLEWCAGKGHLGRWLSAGKQRQVLSLEWQAELCTQGQAEANRLKLAQGFVQADVLLPASQQYLQSQQHAVALHACGDLHLQLLQSASTAQTQQIDLIPCCYHLIRQPDYIGLSQQAQQGQLLPLSKEQLKLAVQSQSTAGERIARLRHLEVWWRLSYQALYQHCTGQQGYRPLESVPKHWFSGKFRAFADFAAQSHGWTLPDTLELQPFLDAGAKRQAQVRRLQLVRSAFAPALELCLVLDRVLYLQEQGYQVQLRRFCPASLTPRNWWISAARR
ncbi:MULTISPECIES: methyltransferase [Rheinheimera]|uniref:Methyltransferase n=1 Tax=Rheinheimera marina TaxID=1774958 RepID=A0ABV9JG23_9GAMM